MGGRRPVVVLAAAWAMVFAVVHVAWAVGWNGGLGAVADAAMTGWFLVYDVVAAVGCLVAAWFAWVGSWRWCAAVAAVLVLRSALGVAQAVGWAVTGRPVWRSTSWVEVWFVVGAAVFVGAVLALRSGRARSPRVAP